MFQSTRPARGATSIAVASSEQIAVFQSTRPARGATAGKTVWVLPPKVSIHAPRAGRDLLEKQGVDLLIEFQSTRPARGATINIYSIGQDVTSGLIPRMRGDIRMSENGVKSGYVQLTNG